MFQYDKQPSMSNVNNVDGVLYLQYNEIYAIYETKTLASYIVPLNFLFKHQGN